MLIFVGMTTLSAQDSLNVSSLDTSFTSELSTLTADSLTIDSTSLYNNGVGFSESSDLKNKKTEKPAKVKEPLDPEMIHGRKAAYWAIIPGGGQIYNKRWWKLPIVYGLLGGAGYLVTNNALQMRDYNKALDTRFSGGIDPYAGFLSDQQLIANRNFYRRNLQLTAVGFVALWGLSVIDAVVDAHLRTFDINDNLSLKFRPKVLTVSNKSVPSLSISLML
jgi:hypothetical protein